MTEQVPTPAKELELADEHWRVRVAPDHGFAIVSACDVHSGAEICWRRTPRFPGPFTRDLPPGGPQSEATFMDAFAGGWFPMFPDGGYAGELDGRSTLYHGELCRLPWEVVDRGPCSIAARVETVRAPFAVVRRVTLTGGDLRIETLVSNIGEAPASYLFGEHPCFPFATFAGGGVELKSRRAWVPDPAIDPARAVLELGRSFAWPHAPTGGGTLDLSAVPHEPDGRHDQACVELAAPLVQIDAPRFGRRLELELDLAVTPYAVVWQKFDAAGVFAVEPRSYPGRSVSDAHAAGAVRRLAPGERFETAVALRWVTSPTAFEV